MKLGFGSNVKIRATPVTEKLGLVDEEGVVLGETTPSTSGITEIIYGESEEDYAVNVLLYSNNEQYWFSEDLIESIGFSTSSIIGRIVHPREQ